MVTQTILVVDDDKDIVRLVRGYLEKDGYRVLTAYNGDSAVHTIASEKPDLVVLDLMLPDRDGFDITRAVRGNPSLRATPIIMLTARVEDMDKILGLEMGADDYITKPFNPRELVARVRALLRRTELDADGPGSQLLRVGELTMDVGSRTVAVADQEVDLTPTEFDLLKLLLENPGYAFTNQIPNRPPTYKRCTAWAIGWQATAHEPASCSTEPRIHRGYYPGADDARHHWLRR